ncbi:recombinase family protein [Mycobacterium avium]|uniref:recombinase family protein n=1 Tax=Mycobacterium avium TaxID=1764 RepID=UPI000CE437A1|nr:recombinase family protein [Mycobacterium avium]
MTIRAVVGARVSNVQGPQKTSHLSQRSKGEAYAESQGWEVLGAFEDLDVSAIKLSPWERPDLREWLGDRAEEWDALIFAKTDRVFRSAADCVRLAEWCKEHRKILVLVDDGIRLDYFNPEESKDAFAGAMSKVFLILASVFAEIEGQRFIQRARDRVAFLRDTDRWGYGTPPYGFQTAPHPSGKGKTLVHDPEAQRVIKDAAKRFLAGTSLTRIAKDFNEEGIPTGRGGRWVTSTVRRVLSHPGMQGLKTYKGKVVLDGNGEPVHVGPPSFDGRTWDRLQQELAQRASEPRTRRHSTNPLLGVIKCAWCDANLAQRTHVSKGREYRYYACGRQPKACPGVSMPALDAEKLVEDEFLRYHRDRRIKARVWRNGSDHSAELEQTKLTIESLREDRAMGLFTTPEDQLMFRQQMKALIAKRDSLEKMPIVRAGWAEVETDQTYGEVWPTATVEEKRKMLTDAGVTLTVTSPRQRHLHVESLTGEGSEAV